MYVLQPGTSFLDRREGHRWVVFNVSTDVVRIRVEVIKSGRRLRNFSRGIGLRLLTSAVCGSVVLCRRFGRRSQLERGRECLAKIVPFVGIVVAGLHKPRAKRYALAVDEASKAHDAREIVHGRVA